MNDLHAHHGFRNVSCLRQFIFVLAAAVTVALGSASASAVLIGPGQTATLQPRGPGNQHGLTLEIRDPRGIIEFQDITSSNVLLGTTAILLNPAGDGQYEMDITYRSTAGLLVDIESVVPGVNFVGNLDGGGATLDDWVSEHTRLNSGKIIWSYSSGDVIVYDPNAAKMDVHTSLGDFSATVPPLANEIVVEHEDLDILLSNGTTIPMPATTHTGYSGDLDEDEFVGLNDLDIVLNHWNQKVTPGSKLMGDPTADGFVGLEDLDEILTAWNKGTPPPASVPEPAAATLLLFGSLALIRGRN